MRNRTRSDDSEYEAELLVGRRGLAKSESSAIYFSFSSDTPYDAVGPVRVCKVRGAGQYTASSIFDSLTDNIHAGVLIASATYHNSYDPLGPKDHL